jgi:hypothetical protein
MAAHALTTFTFRWNSPGWTGVFTSAMTATRISDLVSPTSEPGAAVPEAGVLETGALGAGVLADAVPAEVEVPGAGVLTEELADEQPASRAIAASPPARTPRTRDRRDRYGMRELDSLLHFFMLHLYNERPRKGDRPPGIGSAHAMYRRTSRLLIAKSVLD